MNEDAAEYERTNAFLAANLRNKNFAVSELVFLELYVSLRNPAIFPRPLSAAKAAGVIQALRSNPHWKILNSRSDTWDQVWSVASQTDFPRHAIFDPRLAYSLAADGVTQFATRNLRDFHRFNTFEVFDPTESAL